MHSDAHVLPLTPKRPRWISAYLLFLAAISLNTAVLGYAAPGLLFGDTLDPSGAASVTMFYATRNLAVAVLCFVALFSRDDGIAYSAILVRLVIESADLGFALHYGLVDAHWTLVAGGWFGVFILPQLLCLWALRTGGKERVLRFAESVRIAAPGESVWDIDVYLAAQTHWLIRTLERYDPSLEASDMASGDSRRAPRGSSAGTRIGRRRGARRDDPRAAQRLAAPSR